MPVVRDARFVADVTIPDGTVLRPGQHFKKTWQLENSGTVTWGKGFRFVPSGKPDLGSAAGVAMEMTPPLADVDVSADLVAPRTPGSYREFWQMVGPDGRSFGIRAWVSVVVETGNPGAGAVGRATPTVSAPAALPETGETRTPESTAASTLQNSATATGPPPNATPSAADPQADPSAGLGTDKGNSVAARGATPALVLAKASSVQPYQIASDTGDVSAYAGDVTIPDGTVLAPGTHFTKTWRIKNAGTTSWTPSYTWRFQAGTLMSSRMTAPVPPTAPGAITTISVPMIAPTATGVYTSFWQMANASGKFFPHQAWVNIVVKAGAAGSNATATPVRGAFPTATPEASATEATGSAPTASPPNSQPTQAIIGGDGQLVASPWIGVLSYRVYFSSGSTVGSMQESIGVYYPGAGRTHVRLTLYRSDAAQRILQFTLVSGERRVFSLSRIAPSTGVAVSVEADRRIVAERVDTTSSGVLANPAVEGAAHSWLYPSIPNGAPPVQQLVLFNPHDSPATVHAHIDVVTGGCCAADLTFKVPPYAQYVYRLGTLNTLRGPLSLQANEAVAAERLAVSSDMSSVVGIPGATAAARTWYLTDVRGGAAGMVTLFNPGSVPALATIRIGLTAGVGPWLQRSVPAHTEIRVPVTSLTSAPLVSAEVSSTGLIVAGSAWLGGAAMPVVAVGSVTTADAWSIIVGFDGGVTSDTLSIFNPSARAAAVSIRVAKALAKGTTMSIVVPANGRYSVSLTRLEPAGGAIVDVTAAQPIAVQHIVADGSGAAVSPAAIMNGS